MKKGPPVTRADVEKLKECLDQFHGWLKAHIITRILEWDSRFIRAVASDSDGQIIGSQHGYMLTRNATPEEVRHAINDHRSRAESHNKRGDEIEAAYWRATQPVLL